MSVTYTDGRCRKDGVVEAAVPRVTQKSRDKVPFALTGTSRWRRHFVYRTEVLRTTWTFRLAILIVVVLTPWLIRGFWIPWLGRSLVCAEDVRRSDVILIENFDPTYLLFERATALQEAGLSAKVLVATKAARDGPTAADPVSLGIAERRGERRHRPRVHQRWHGHHRP
jgi:hypothetical protein